MPRLLAVSLLLVICGAASAQQDELPCDQAHIIYEKYVPRESELQIAKVNHGPKPTGAVEKSPQGTKWYSRTQPDYMKNGPWTSTVLVGDESGTVFGLVFPNHGSGGVTAQWINDQLLFLTVWPGRIVSIDLILNVETGKLIYSERANYGLVTRPCK